MHKPMTNRRLARRLRRAARFKHFMGHMSAEDRDKIVAGSRDKAIVKKWRKALNQDAPWRGRDKLLTEKDWTSIWDWLIANWATILKILLLVLV